MLYALNGTGPTLAIGAWAAPSADLIGDVRLGNRASVWFGAIIRADNTPILVGEDTNIQDGAIGHSDPGFPLTIGARVTVGHQAILHGCAIADVGDDLRRALEVLIGVPATAPVVARRHALGIVLIADAGATGEKGGRTSAEHRRTNSDGRNNGCDGRDLK